MPENPESVKTNPANSPLQHATDRLKAALPSDKAQAVLNSIADKQPQEKLTALRDALPLHLASVGRIFPLRWKSKLPAFKNYLELASQDPVTIRQWVRSYPDCNFGITINAADFDSRIKTKDGKPLKDRSGMDLYRAERTKNGKPPSTYMVQTWSGGGHVYVLDALPNGAGTLGDDGTGDSRAEGKGYVVASGSYIEQDGKSGFYRTINHAAIASVPWIAGLVNTARPGVVAGDVIENPEPLISNELLAECLAGLNPDDFIGNAEWEPLAMSCHYATAGQGFAEFQEWCLSKGSKDEWEAENESRWNSFKVRASGNKEIESAGGLIEALRKVNREDLVAKIVGESVWSDIGPEEIANDNLIQADPTRVYSRGYTGDEMMAVEFVREPELIEGLLLARTAQKIDADGGIGKSLITAQMCVHRASGADFFGRKVQQGPAIFITHEDDYVEVKQRMLNTAKSIGLKDGLAGLPLRTICILNDDLTIATINEDGRWTQGPYYPAFNSLLAETPGALVVMDCRSDFVHGDFIKSRDVPNTFYKTILNGFARKYGSTPLVICHPSKASMADGSWSEGTTGNTTAIRRQLVMKLASKDSPDGPRWFGPLKTNYSGRDKLQKVVWRNGIFVLDSDPNLSEETVAQYEMIVGKIIGLIEKGITVVKFNQASGQGPEAISRAIAEDRTDDDGVPLAAATEKEVRAALDWAERKGRLRYIKAEKGTRIKARYEIVGPGERIIP